MSDNTTRLHEVQGAAAGHYTIRALTSLTLMFESVEFMLDGTPEQKNYKASKAADHESFYHVSPTDELDENSASENIEHYCRSARAHTTHDGVNRRTRGSRRRRKLQLVAATWRVCGCGFRVMLHSMLATSMLIHIRGSMLVIDCEAIQCFGDVPLGSAIVETPGCVIRHSRRDLPATDTIATPTWILCCTSRSDTLARLRMSDSGHPPEKVPRVAPLQVACKLCTFMWR
jgi:hypothetical protein